MSKSQEEIQYNLAISCMENLLPANKTAIKYKLLLNLHMEVLKTILHHSILSLAKDSTTRTRLVLSVFIKAAARSQDHQ